MDARAFRQAQWRQRRWRPIGWYPVRVDDELFGRRRGGAPLDDGGGVGADVRASRLYRYGAFLQTVATRVEAAGNLVDLGASEHPHARNNTSRVRRRRARKAPDLPGNFYRRRLGTSCKREPKFKKTAGFRPCGLPIGGPGLRSEHGSSSWPSSWSPDSWWTTRSPNRTNSVSTQENYIFFST